MGGGLRQVTDRADVEVVERSLSIPSLSPMEGAGTGTRDPSPASPRASSQAARIPRHAQIICIDTPGPNVQRLNYQGMHLHAHWADL